MQQKQIETYESNRKPSPLIQWNWENTFEITLDVVMLCSIQHQSSQKYSHSIPACIALRPVLRKSAQPPQWWFFATSCHLGAGLISMTDLETDSDISTYVDPWNSSPTEGFFWEQVEGSLWFGWWIFITSTDWITAMDVTELSIHRLCWRSFPQDFFFCCYPSLLNFLWINKNRKVRDVIFASQKSETVIFFTDQSQLRSCFVRIPLD